MKIFRTEYEKDSRNRQAFVSQEGETFLYWFCKEVGPSSPVCRLGDEVGHKDLGAVWDLILGGCFQEDGTCMAIV